MPEETKRIEAVSWLSCLPVNIRIIPTADGFEIGLEERRLQIYGDFSQGRSLIVVPKDVRRVILHMRSAFIYKKTEESPIYAGASVLKAIP